MPTKTLAYISVTVYVIVLQYDHVPGMLMTIFKSAFGLGQAFAGLVGSAIGGVFANEAGLGSAPNVAAAAQGVVQAFSVFLDTLVICTCTALLILLSGFYTPGFEGDGLVLIQNALAAVVGGWGLTFISVALALFVFTSILANTICAFLLGDKRAAVIVYRGLVLLLIL